MKLYSTKNTDHKVDLRTAVLKGLPPDNGLYMPEALPKLPDTFFEQLQRFDFEEIAYQVAHNLIGADIPQTDLRRIIKEAIDFPAPVVSLSEQLSVLELFHGPSLAFKDFGARFMAKLMGYFNRNESRELTILVATSGDTGGAVAAGFYQTPGIRVIILYPSGRVSLLQEKQLTTLGHNIAAVEIDGSFDDCQALVKRAFLDTDLNEKHRLSSANSINIARLIPQSFYYFEAYRQLQTTEPVTFVVPSGNFGNLTAGIFAKEMGLPIQHLVAATNDNDVVPKYLATGTFSPMPSKRTLSNAMDVGNPSNFGRMLDVYCSTWNTLRENIIGFSYDDKTTEKAMQEIADKFNYIMDPHGTVGYLAALEYQQSHPNQKITILETAHPAKFVRDVERVLDRKIKVPERLERLRALPKSAVQMSANYSEFKNYLYNLL